MALTEVRYIRETGPGEVEFPKPMGRVKRGETTMLPADVAKELTTNHPENWELVTGARAKRVGQRKRDAQAK